MNFPPIVRWLLWPLSFVFGVFVRLRAWCYRNGIFKSRRLQQPVINIGNLTVGGTGKTPMVLWIAARLRTESKRVGILTRGYRGVGQRGPKNDSPEPSRDEARLLAGRLQVPIGIGANRFAAAMAMQLEGIEVFLLDDGFQALRLARDLDIVLVDATNPFGGGWLLPAGPLREPPSALSRADIVVITRSEHAPAVETIVRRHTAAPIFFAQTRLLGVYERSSPIPGARTVDASQHRYLMFCGIGNPQAFRDDLGRWGIRLLGSTFFRDHHRYTQREADQLERLARAMGATALLTTEKDIFNLEDSEFQSFPVHFCRIEIKLSNENEFWSLISKTLTRHSESTQK